MTETLAALTTFAVFAGAVRLTWLALMDQRITPRTLVGLPRRKPSALAKTVDALVDEHGRADGVGSF